MRFANTGLLTPAWPLFLMALVGPTSDGQPAIRRSVCGGNPVFRPAPAPLEIVEGKLETLWSSLGIPAKVRIATNRGFETGTKEIDCATGCEASIVSGDRLLTEDGYDSVVRVCTHFATACRFLVLHHGSAGWSLVDYVDSPSEKYEAPTAWVVAAQDRRWLVKRGFGGGGTGVYLALADWFEIRCGALRPVLALPLRGDDVNEQPARYFSTRFKAFHKVRDRESLEFAYVILFEDYENGRQLWQEERTVVFSRTNQNELFRFDPVASGISAAFEEKVFDLDSMNRNDFIDFAYDHLLRIARDPADLRWDWLYGYLSKTPETAKVKTLKAVLSEQKRTQPGGGPKP